MLVEQHDRRHGSMGIGPTESEQHGQLRDHHADGRAAGEEFPSAEQWCEVVVHVEWIGPTLGDFDRSSPRCDACHTAVVHVVKIVALFRPVRADRFADPHPVVLYSQPCW